MSEKIDDIIHEIKEDVQLEQLIKFLKKYARWIALGILLLITISISYGLWHHFHQKKQQADALVFDQALQAADSHNLPEALNLLGKLKQQGSEGFRLLALFREAMTVSSQEEKIAIYSQIMQDKKVESKFHDLATILWAYEILDTGNPLSVEQKLLPISEGLSPWKNIAQELLALVAIRQEDKKKAQHYLHSLITSKDVIPDIKKRAIALYELLNL